MKRLKTVWNTARFVLLVLWLGGGAVSAGASDMIGGLAQNPGHITVFVTSNGWHTGIVLPRAALPPDSIPETADFPRATYFSFGWGDAKYYPARDTTVGMALAAAISPSPAVLHFSGLPGLPQTIYPKNETLVLLLSPQQVRGLVAYLDSGFDRSGSDADPPRVESVTPGLDRYSRFYPATGKFHLFNTCNTWVANGLAAAGLDVRPSGVVTAEDLMQQVRIIAE